MKASLSGPDVMATDTRSVFLSGPNPLLVLLLQYILPPVLLQLDRVTILTSVAKSAKLQFESGLLHPQSRRYANFLERPPVFCIVCTFRRAAVIITPRTSSAMTPIMHRAREGGGTIWPRTISKLSQSYLLGLLLCK